MGSGSQCTPIPLTLCAPTTPALSAPTAPAWPSHPGRTGARWLQRCSKAIVCHHILTRRRLHGFGPAAPACGGPRSLRRARRGVRRGGPGSSGSQRCWAAEGSARPAGQPGPLGGAGGGTGRGGKITLGGAEAGRGRAQRPGRAEGCDRGAAAPRPLTLLGTRTHVLCTRTDTALLTARADTGPSGRPPTY